MVLLIYTDNFHFLSLPQFMHISPFPKRVEDRQTDQQTDQPIRLVSSLKNCCDRATFVYVGGGQDQTHFTAKFRFLKFRDSGNH